MLAARQQDLQLLRKAYAGSIAAETTKAKSPVKSADDPSSDIVLDYCAAVRGILNDDQGGPLDPPGLRTAAVLEEVHDSLQRNLDAKKKGPTEKRLSRLADCIERGLKHVRAEQEAIRECMADIKNIAETLEPENARCEERKGRFETLIDQFRETEDPIRLQMAKVMPSFQSGLFSGKTPLPRFATISISNAGFACQKAIRARFTAGVMLVCGWSKTGRHWSWHSMPMRPIRNTFGGITNAIARL